MEALGIVQWRNAPLVLLDKVKVVPTHCNGPHHLGGSHSPWKHPEHQTQDGVCSCSIA